MLSQSVFAPKGRLEPHHTHTRTPFIHNMISTQATYNISTHTHTDVLCFHMCQTLRLYIFVACLHVMTVVTSPGQQCSEVVRPQGLPQKGDEHRPTLLFDWCLRHLSDVT